MKKTNWPLIAFVIVVGAVVSVTLDSYPTLMYAWGIIVGCVIGRICK